MSKGKKLTNRGVKTEEYIPQLTNQVAEEASQLISSSALPSDDSKNVFSEWLLDSADLEDENFCTYCSGSIFEAAGNGGGSGGGSSGEEGVEGGDFYGDLYSGGSGGSVRRQTEADDLYARRSSGGGGDCGSCSRPQYHRRYSCHQHPKRVIDEIDGFLLRLESLHKRSEKCRESLAKIEVDFETLAPRVGKAIYCSMDSDEVRVALYFFFL